MLADIFRRSAASRREIQVVGHIATAARLITTARRKKVDFVVTGLGQPELRPVAQRLLEELPRTRVIAVEDDGRRTSVYELRPHRAALGELSPAELVDAIVAAARVARGATWSTA